MRAAAYDIFGNEGDMWFKVSHREVRSHQRPQPDICSRARSAANRYGDMHFADSPPISFYYSLCLYCAFTVPIAKSAKHSKIIRLADCRYKLNLYPGKSQFFSAWVNVPFMTMALEYLLKTRPAWEVMTATLPPSGHLAELVWIHLSQPFLSALVVVCSLYNYADCVTR